MTKPTKWHVRPSKTQISLGIRPVCSESPLSAWRKLGSLATHWAHSEDSDQTGRMHRLIWVFGWRTVILLVLSWGGPNPFSCRYLTVAPGVIGLWLYYREPGSKSFSYLSGIEGCMTFPDLGGLTLEWNNSHLNWDSYFVSTTRCCACGKKQPWRYITAYFTQITVVSI